MDSRHWYSTKITDGIFYYDFLVTRRTSVSRLNRDGIRSSVVGWRSRLEDVGIDRQRVRGLRTGVGSGRVLWHVGLTTGTDKSVELSGSATVAHSLAIGFVGRGRWFKASNTSHTL